MILSTKTLWTLCGELKETIPIHLIVIGQFCFILNNQIQFGHLNPTQNTELIKIISSFCYFSSLLWIVSLQSWKLISQKTCYNPRWFAIGIRQLFAQIKLTAILFINKYLKKWIQVGGFYVEMVSYIEWLRTRELGNSVTFKSLSVKRT